MWIEASKKGLAPSLARFGARPQEPQKANQSSTQCTSVGHQGTQFSSVIGHLGKQGADLLRTRPTILS